ncbi:MAG: prepilin-type N-terminal cleavage/methylation domain-containing protein [Azonexus sp.]|nr:prepilin-type N-terminal cleavage/methylation domain-containing protein [Azonexus sp.]
MHHATELKYRDGGFTLVEMIIVISITGVLIAAMSLFGRQQIEAYFDVSGRAILADGADTALRRIGRELQAALPNSVRVNGNFLEFVPVTGGGRYRADFTPAGTLNPLDLNDPADNGFDILGPTVDTVAGDQLVIFNLGQVGSDVYAGSSRRALTTIGNALSALGFSGAQFPFGSPLHRFQIVNGPVTYECDTVGQVLRRRWGYGFSTVQPIVFAAGSSSTLVDHVVGCTITYSAGALARNGIVVIRLRMQAENGETVDLMHQVEVLNAP